MHTDMFPEVVVNGEVVPRATIVAEALNHPAPRDKPLLAWSKAARALAVRALLLQEARRRGLAVEPAELAPGRFESEEEATIRALLEDALDLPPVTGAAIRAEWEKNPERFRSPPLWEVSHILVACDPRDENARQTAEARARAILARLDGSAKDFARTARRESEDGSASAGGSLGQLRPGDTVPEFESALRHLAAGETTAEPVLTRHGWHIVRLDAVAPGKVLPFEAVRQKIGEALEKAAWARASRALVAELAADAEIAGIRLAPPRQ